MRDETPVSRPRRWLAHLATALVLASSAGAQVPDFTSQAGLPIDLDAASSEFDRRNNRLVFQRMTITQGAMRITADVAEATRLDFENSRWVFRGNVTIENQGAQVTCDDADLAFLGHALRSARLTGAPARFRQQRPGKSATEGRAGTIDYDVAAATIRLSGKAWLSDGANEVNGERISYDLRREYVTAEAGTGGPVRMRINPPAKSDTRDKAP